MSNARTTWVVIRYEAAEVTQFGEFRATDGGEVTGEIAIATELKRLGLVGD